MTRLIGTSRIIPSRPRRNAPGAVLLLVLCAVAILTVLSVEVAHRARLDVQRSQRMAQSLTFKRAFDSGIAAARGLLIESRTSPAFDYFGDSWSKSLHFELPDGLNVHVQIYDESGKLNLLKLKAQRDGYFKSNGVALICVPVQARF